MTVYDEIQAERLRAQDMGFAQKDDENTAAEWCLLIVKHLGLAMMSPKQFRRHLLVVAALCVAAIEALDKKEG